MIVAVFLFFYWRDVNSAIRRIYPGWPFLFAVPILFYAYSRHSQTNAGGRHRPLFVRERLMSLFRANLALPLGGRTFRLYLFCHGIPDRCCAIRGHTLPICARCTGLLIGVGAGFLVPAPLYLGPIVAMGLASLLVGPLLVDGFTQLAGFRQSTNPQRLATGVIAGLGFAFAAQVLRHVLLGF